MRKILAVLTVLVLGLVLVACSPDTSEIDTFLSPNKIVYTIEETNAGGPIIELGDFEFYSIQQNKTSSRVSIASTEVTRNSLGNNVYEITVRGLSYNVYVYEEGYEDTVANPNQIVVSALSPTFGVEDAAEKIRNVNSLFFTVITNEIDLTYANVISARYNTQSNTTIMQESGDNVAKYLTKPENYAQNVFKMSSENLMTFSFHDMNDTVVTVNNLTYKPADNQLPIHTEMENTWLGYIWDWVFIIPISFLMQFFASMFGLKSFGIGIIFATIIVRTIAWPIYAKANDMSIKMALAQPELTKLQNKYAMKKDPASQQKMQMETMQLYKKHGISILGCFTPILQMPIFLAMFQTVYRITIPGGIYAQNVNNSTILFGLIDLSAGGFNDFMSYILAALVGASMWLLQHLSQKKPSYAKNTGSQVKTAQAEQQAKTMQTVSRVMIAMMVLTTISSVNALGFYWVIGNMYSISQSFINRRLSEQKYEKSKAAQSII
jgi:YidC/Oxa1 family membrane protein insertase